MPRAKPTANGEPADPSALLQILIEQRESLVRTAERITHCHFKAEDVVQEAFFRLQNSSMSNLPPKALLSYVRQTVSNLAIDMSRAQSIQEKRFLPAEEGMDVPAHDGSPETRHCQHEALAIIESALYQLPIRFRYSFEMYRLYGKPQKDIAQELNISISMVSIMIRDAMIHCRKAIRLLQGDGPHARPWE